VRVWTTASVSPTDGRGPPESITNRLPGAKGSCRRVRWRGPRISRTHSTYLSKCPVWIDRGTIDPKSDLARDREWSTPGTTGSRGSCRRRRSVDPAGAGGIVAHEALRQHDATRKRKGRSSPAPAHRIVPAQRAAQPGNRTGEEPSPTMPNGK